MPLALQVVPTVAAKRGVLTAHDKIHLGGQVGRQGM